MRKLLRKALLFFSVIGLDFITKQGAIAYLSDASLSWQYPFGGLPVFRDLFGISLSFNYVENTGAAWGMLSEYTLLLLVMRVLLVGYLAWTLFTQKKSALFTTGVVCILAGAIGNIVDMVLYGYVVDMIKVVLWGYHYPVFNIADMSIVVGLTFLLVSEFFFPAPKEETLVH